MRFLLAGVAAAAVSWVGNRAALKLIGIRVIVGAAPLIEELAKTGAAVLSGSSIILTHATFGLVEGFYDAWRSGVQGIEAGITSVAGHLIYGYVTYLVMQKTAVFAAAVMTGYTVHMLWNITVLKFIVIRRKTDEG